MSDIVRIRLTIAYDGSAYAGWQIQKVGLGVQQRIEEAFEKIYGAAYRPHSSSRTDTGVHALGMVATVDIPRENFKVPLPRLPIAINAQLPEDIRIVDAVETDPEFNARFEAKGKQYRYFIWNAPAANPLLRRTAWHLPTDLDIPLMREHSRRLIGTHDFKSFANTREYEMKNTVRTLTRISIRRAGPLLAFVIEGEGFLYKMCRGIVGTLTQIGTGQLAGEELDSILASRSRDAAGTNAPAHGLVLWKVFYE
jgi:tRNA pseudouridine38-40 synthase